MSLGSDSGTGTFFLLGKLPEETGGVMTSSDIERSETTLLQLLSGVRGEVRSRPAAVCDSGVGPDTHSLSLSFIEERISQAPGVAWLREVTCMENNDRQSE